MSQRQSVDDAVVESIVEAVLRRMGGDQRCQHTLRRSARPCMRCLAQRRELQPRARTASSAASPITPHPCGHQRIGPYQLEALVAQTPSRIAMGRAGCRLRTDDYLRTREGHADARDAVHSEVPPDWAARLKLCPADAQCRDRNHYLLYPNAGRRLCEASKTALAPHITAAGSTVPDVQLIVGMGCRQTPSCRTAKPPYWPWEGALSAAGFRLGVPRFVRFARIGVADEIGVLTRARASVILVGERPASAPATRCRSTSPSDPSWAKIKRREELHLQRPPHRYPSPKRPRRRPSSSCQRGFERGVGVSPLGLGWGRR